jgi:hypothetical protein
VQAACHAGAPHGARGRVPAAASLLPPAASLLPAAARPPVRVGRPPLAAASPPTAIPCRAGAGLPVELPPAGCATSPFEAPFSPLGVPFACDSRLAHLLL